MPNPNAVVARIVGLEPGVDQAAVGRGLSVELDDGRRVQLDPRAPQSAALAQILDGLRQRRRPVYLEIDPATSTITQVRIPLVTRVSDIRTLDADRLSIELEQSHARHVLRHGDPDFGELQKQLNDAVHNRQPLIITEDDSHNIIDVRPFIPAPDDPLPGLPELPPRRVPRNWLWDLLHRVWLWHWWPWWWFGCISMTRAQQVFNAMNATSCSPLTVPVPCIPFLYPDDGCWGRAHEMCRLMIGMGLKPRKVWIQGSLHVNTKNNPNCAVYWGWHVAPTLCVRGRWWFSRRMVIDPSLFTTPVSQATWKGVQGDPSATLTDSAASIFYLWGNMTDPTYAYTNQVLADYRAALQLRSIQVGPPPYAQCP